MKGGRRPTPVAGLSVWALCVPQGLAYASIVGKPLQYGRYTAFAALIAYPPIPAQALLAAIEAEDRTDEAGG